MLVAFQELEIACWKFYPQTVFCGQMAVRHCLSVYIHMSNVTMVIGTLQFILLTGS